MASVSPASGDIVLYRCVNNAFISLGSAYDGTPWTIGQERVLEMSVTGYGATVTIELKLDGVTVMAVEDTSASRIVSTGYGGFWISGASGTELNEIRVGPVADLDGTGDATAPTLTSASGSATGAATASGSVTTDEGNGTLYAVATTSATAPTKAQVKAGQDHTGSAAAWSGSQAVSSPGSKSVSATGLSASTSYYLHFMHEDAAANQSDVASSSSFTTDAPDTTAPTLTNPTATATNRTTASGSVSTNEANGTLFCLASQNASESASAVKAGSSQSVSATGAQSVSVTGLTTATSYYLHFVHRDAAGNDSTVSTSAQFTTFSLPALANLFVLGDSTSSAYSGQNAVSSYLDVDYDIVDLAVPGDSIDSQKADWNAYDSDDRLAGAYIIVQLGLNDLAPTEAASVAIARLQALVDDVAADVQSGAKIVIAQMTPCRARLIAIYGTTNGQLAYQKWLDMNEAIAGGGATPITGVDGRVTAHVALLNDGAGNLAAAYDTGDGIHENNAGRAIVATAWQEVIELLEDSTAPIISDLSAVATGATTATITFNTDEAHGDAYVLLDDSATATEAGILAGLSQSVTATGEQTIEVSGLDASTSYHVHVLHRDAAGNVSDIPDAVQFTTDAIPIKGAEITLYSGITPRANLNNIIALWWDAATPSGAPVVQTTTASTDAFGVLSLDIDSATSLNIGDAGFLLLYKLDAIDHRDSLAFAGRLNVVDIA